MNPIPLLLSNSISKNKSYSKTTRIKFKIIDSLWTQLSTIGTDGYPSNRTIVFRGFLHDYIKLNDSVSDPILIFCTDLRSQKVKELELNPKSSLCWYFPDTKEQFRLNGDAFILQNSIQVKNENALNISPQEIQDVKLSVWKNISNKTRAQFSWPHPKHPIDTESTNVPLEKMELNDDMESDALNNFGLLLLIPNRVDYLKFRNVGPFPNQRYLYSKRKDDSWDVEQVNP